MGWLILAIFAAAIVPAAAAVWLRPILALYALAIGLVLHNAVFMLLYAAGARGWQLTVAQSWKEVLFAVAICRVCRDAWRERQLPFRPHAVDAAATVFIALTVVYALAPQHLLDGAADTHARLYGLRHLLIAPLAYLLGRALAPSSEQLAKLVVIVIGSAAVVTVAGIAEEYLVSVERWRALGVARYFHDQLAYPQGYGPGGLPENFVFNATDGVFRRLVSFFLSSIGAAYFLVAAVCLAAAGAAARVRRGLVAALVLVAFAGLLFTFTRAAFLALAGGLVVLSATARRRAPAIAAGLVVAVGFAFAAAFPSIAPRTHFLREDLARQAALAAKTGRKPASDPLRSSLRLSDPSSRSHLDELESGTRSIVSHPQGYGVGNSGSTAARFGVVGRAGESFYLEVGADVGVAGLVAWLVFTVLVLHALFVRARWSSAPFDRRLAAGVLAATAALSAAAVITDVWGSPWPAYLVWSLAGAALAAAPQRAPEPQVRRRLVAA